MNIENMSNEEKRITIAVACGKCPHAETEEWSIEDGNDFDWGYRCKKCGEDPHTKRTDPPDYLNDLNAMHAAEKTLSHAKQDEFIDALLAVIILPAEAEYGAKTLSDSDTMWMALHATAAQRADAFLLTLS